MPASVAVRCRSLSPSGEAKKIRKEEVIGRMIGKFYEKIRSSLRLWMDNNEDGRQRSKATFVGQKKYIFRMKKGMLICFRL